MDDCVSCSPENIPRNCKECQWRRYSNSRHTELCVKINLSVEHDIMKGRRNKLCPLEDLSEGK